MSPYRNYNSGDVLTSVLKYISFILFCFSSNLSFGQSNQQKPNLIIILADDLGYGDLGIQGSKQIPTPHIDQLAKEGVVFTAGYVSSPVCSPSRAGLLTGKNQLSFGYNNNIGPDQPGFDPEFKGLPVSEKTLADKLKSLGYATGLIGKWHLGDKPQFHPTKRGFDQFWGFLAGGHDYFQAKMGGNEIQSPIQCNFKNVTPVTYLTEDIGNESVDFIKRNKHNPFFLFASFNAPHAPMQALDDDLKLFSSVQDELRRTYCAMVYRLDINVGKILNSLRQEGLEKNTFIVFLSDNGGPSVDPISNGSVNAPFRGQKTTLLEGGIRVPFIFKWPEQFQAGKKIDHMIWSLDICPTFIVAAGGTISDKDNYRGINLIPFITGLQKTAPHESMEWAYTVSTAIREGDWKLISLPDRLPLLYNIAEDIVEQNDVSMKNIKRTNAMLKKLGDWGIQLPHPVFLEPSSWRIRHLKFYDSKYQLVQPN